MLGARGGPKAKAKATAQQESKSPEEANMELKEEAKADQNGHIMEMDLAEMAKAGSHASPQQEILDQPEVEPLVKPETRPVDPPGLAVPLVKPPAREECHSSRSNATSSTAPGTPNLPNDVSAEDGGEAGEDDGVIRTWQWRNNALDIARQMTPAQQLSSLSTKEMGQFTADLKRMMKTYDQANPKAAVSARRLNESRYTNILREKYVYKRE